jgi:hypothetical protein
MTTRTRHLGFGRGVVPLLVVLLGYGCGRPASTVQSRVGENTTSRLLPTDLSIELGAIDGPVTITRDKAVVATGASLKGTTIAVTVEDVPCVLDVLGQTHDTDSDYRAGAERPTAKDLRSRTLGGLIVKLRCPSGPVPGTEATLRGAHSLPALPWSLPGLILGIIAGLYARPQRRDSKRMERTGTFAILAVIAGGVCAQAMFDSPYSLPLGILFVALAIAGVVGGRLAEPTRRHAALAWTLAAMIGPVVIAVLLPMWNSSAPIGALLAGGALAAAAYVVAVTIKPT